MKIAVLVKQVPGSESVLPINEGQSWKKEDPVTFVMNPQITLLWRRHY
ncbi:hypothetical protein Ct9H90mP29_08490 [bacterium]|nr:MAG: hypothetical protein Ct9H90mP29_08490 [bacterium]